MQDKLIKIHSVKLREPSFTIAPKRLYIIYMALTPSDQKEANSLSG